jgi:hypothetical protein
MDEKTSQLPNEQANMRKFSKNAISIGDMMMLIKK